MTMTREEAQKMTTYCYTLAWDSWTSVASRFSAARVVRDYGTGIARVYLTHRSAILGRIARESIV